VNFPGTLQELKELVAVLGEPGHWLHEGPFEEFVFDSGERLNWWAGNGQLTLQGHPETRARLIERLVEVDPRLEPPSD
jgi:hypothetical protein